jgi:hypothetical protein
MILPERSARGREAAAACMGAGAREHSPRRLALIDA